MALLGAGNIATLIAQLVFRSILITALVPAAYGRLSLVLSIYNTVWIIGASGLPNSVARYIASTDGADDAAIIRSAVLAGAVPTAIAAVAIAAASGVILNSLIACFFAALGLSTLVYSLLAMGILRGRGRVGFAALIMPAAAIGEVAPLALLWWAGFGVSMVSAFGIFCLGNVIGLFAGILFTVRTTPHDPVSANAAAAKVPSARKLLGFSAWLGAATVGVAILPLIIRSAAALDSYTVVAVIDVALVLFAVPQRLGSIIVLAVVPHATRALGKGSMNLTISLRENLILTIPFILAAAIVAFTPIIGWLFDAIGRPAYSQSAEYLALALLAGPARILYGVVEGVLIAHGEGRFLAVTAVSVTVVASGMIFAAAVMGSIVIAFTFFVITFWVIYLVGLTRVKQLSSVSEPLPA